MGILERCNAVPPAGDIRQKGCELLYSRHHATANAINQPTHYESNSIYRNLSVFRTQYSAIIPQN